MTREEHKNIIQQMLGMVTPENQANASSLLTQLSEDYEKTLTDNESLTATNKTLTTNNETLRDVNAKLFLKVGETNKNNHASENKEQENKEENEREKITFESLFNEKGELI